MQINSSTVFGNARLSVLYARLECISTISVTERRDEALPSLFDMVRKKDCLMQMISVISYISSRLLKMTIHLGYDLKMTCLK